MPFCANLEHSYREKSIIKERLRDTNFDTNYVNRCQFVLSNGAKVIQGVA